MIKSGFDAAQRTVKNRWVAQDRGLKKKEKTWEVKLEQTNKQGEIIKSSADVNGMKKKINSEQP